MKFDEHQEQLSIIVRPLEKRLDVDVSAEFKTHMLELVHNGHLQLVLDLGDVEFIDSSGLGAIIATMKALGDQGQLMICNAGVNVLTLFRLTRMDRVIPVMTDIDAALNAFANRH